MAVFRFSELELTVGIFSSINSLLLHAENRIKIPKENNSFNIGNNNFSVFIITLFLMPNEGVTCPAITTRTTASETFSPPPHAGGSAATAGSG